MIEEKNIFNKKVIAFFHPNIKKIQSPKSPKVDVRGGLPIGGVALPNPEMLKKIKNDPDTMMNMML